MLTSALLLDMTFVSTSMEYDLALPIVTLSIVPISVVTLFTFRVSSSTFLCYKQCGIWTKSADHAEGGIEGQEVGDDARHSASLLS